MKKRSKLFVFILLLGVLFYFKDDIYNYTYSIINTSNEDSPYSYRMFPVICLDLWEHAYFLEYRADRGKYIDNFFKIIDFRKINTRYEKFLKANK